MCCFSLSPKRSSGQLSRYDKLYEETEILLGSVGRLFDVQGSI
jgi:hypothetical protein